jgi:phospholipase A1
MNKIIPVLATVLVFAKCTISLADSLDDAHPPSTLHSHTEGPVGERATKEEKIPPNYFAITFHKPTYILPYYYTASPYFAVYQNNTPGNQQLKREEVKYQFSFKAPIWKNILHYRSSLFLAYTQLSYWQAYNHSAFFRESDYEPELFLANETNLYLFKRTHLNFVNLGVSHQSNGYGSTLERSWNRAYMEAIFSGSDWMLNLKPWYIISKNDNNNDIAKFLGYGQILMSYKYHNQVFSLTVHNVLESGGKRAGAELDWSFPLTPYVKGYLQIFNGYGQSLIEYNHRSKSAGIGIALSDWV